jgi:hypothetical protein
MWTVFGKTDHFIITTNPVVRNDGACVMGAGIAKQFAQRFPNGPFDLGQEIILHERADYVLDYGAIGTYDGQLVQFFMVKDHWGNPAKLRIIRDSARRLREVARHHRDQRYDLNFPGIGNGKLTKEEVLPMIEDLPDNVHVWEYGE